MTGVMICKDKKEYEDYIEWTKDHMIFETATTDQDECEHWFHQFYYGTAYDDGDAYGVVFIGLIQ